MLTLQKQEFQEITTSSCSERTQHHAKSFKHFSRIMIINNKETERFATMKEATLWVMQKRNCTNQEAFWFVQDNKFTMGTDRAIWITI